MFLPTQAETKVMARYEKEWRNVLPSGPDGKHALPKLPRKDQRLKLGWVCVCPPKPACQVPKGTPMSYAVTLLKSMHYIQV